MEYDYNKLDNKDKQQIDTMEEISEEVLTQQAIKDFISEKKFTGKTIQELYSDILNEFTNFLKERIEYRKIDLIIDKIDQYEN